ncbi:hypothetical protein Asulf_01474 [Archaeoglobus sulfaticallidus PM70-1]|uniref:Ribosomal RNA small subunit methyltransferase Nep1 n=1 Tax=Archaeoglobus sulfaticallidus PM70-1 TaxID=387631 RepID=N0BGQ3_9EURY|nr:hypothetical protein [Archaeoglobus sulfaticallidus]AGK61457.1 hypothetical protein Asulf_01474 [Archaeoglobus sulfaticallidus PM70-1]
MDVCFVFLESSLEVIPEEISSHPVIKKEERKRGKKASEIILDDSKHHIAMKSLPNREKRGRPDIVHFCLLSVLDSPISKKAEIYVHTINDEVIKFENFVRLPRNYNRFVGLMEKLFRDGVIESNGRVLIQILDIDFEGLIDKLSGRKFILFTEKGRKIMPDMRGSTIFIGAFPHGDFDAGIMEVLMESSIEMVSLGDESYSSNYVTNKAICFLEMGWVG